jgi:hypothetical protein
VVFRANGPWFFYQKVGRQMNLINFATVFGNEFDLPVHHSEIKTKFRIKK